MARYSTRSKRTESKISGSSVRPLSQIKICSDSEVYTRHRWTAKEAAYKALYPAVRATWKDLRLHRPSGSTKPALDWLGTSTLVGRLHVSISHDGEYVVANVLAEENDRATDEES